MNSTALALLSIFGGVGVTVLAGVIGATIQARRENRRWTRERRYEVYRDFLAALDRTKIGLTSGSKSLPALEAMMQAESHIALIGPDDVVLLASLARVRAVRGSKGDDDSTKRFDEQRAKFIAAARRALDLSNPLSARQIRRTRALALETADDLVARE